MYPWLEVTAEAQHKGSPSLREEPSDIQQVFSLGSNVSSCVSSSKLEHQTQLQFSLRVLGGARNTQQEPISKGHILGKYTSFDLYASPVVSHLIRTEAIILF